MPLADFKFFIDAGLVTPFSNLYQLIHQSDLSDNPRDFKLWFGSKGSSTLKTTVNPGVDTITITPAEILPIWVASKAYVLGDTVEPTVANGFRYVVTAAGTSSATQPTWPTSGIGSTKVDGTVVWTLVAAAHNPNEIKLAATSGGLAGASAGAALSLGTSIASGSGNAKEVNIRVTNAVTNVSNNVGHAELALKINDVTES